MEEPASAIKPVMNSTRKRTVDNNTSDNKDPAKAAEDALSRLFDANPPLKDPKGLLASFGHGRTDKRRERKRATEESLDAIVESFYESGKPTDSRKDVFIKLINGKDRKSKPYALQDLLAVGGDGRSILHIILDPNTYGSRPPFGFERLKPLIEFLLWLSPELPNVTDNAMRTPLFAALSMDESEPAEGDQILTLSRDDKQKIISYICEKSPSCLGSQSGIESLRVATSEGSAKTRSVKGHAVHAVHAAIENGVSMHADVIEQLSKLPVRTDGGEGKVNCLDLPDSKGRSCLHIALTSPLTDTKIEWAKTLARLRPQLLKSTYTSGTGIKKTALTPLQYFFEQMNKDKQERKETRGKTITEAGKTNERLDSLEDFLKKQCLEIFDDVTCKNIMYTRRDVREISLAFEEGDPEPVSWESLTRQSKHYKLDNTIRNVHIPANVSVAWGHENQAELEKVRSWNCVGRTDLYLIFHWLKNRKKHPVKKVFEITVDDIGDGKTKPHSDKAIIESLRGLQVETWDWARWDIPTHVISEAAGAHVKTLFLHCSGLKVVLEAWAGRDGLSTLKNLERVYLETSQGIESIQTMEEYVKKFKVDLEKTFQDVNNRTLKVQTEAIIPAPKESRTASVASKLKGESEQGFQEQDWVKCMDQFADVIEMLEGEKNDRVPIKVALIDDGVKSSYGRLDDYIERGGSWVQQPKPNQRSRMRGHSQNYNTSTYGHGTVMAYYICRMCPRVRLYVAKLNPETQNGESPSRGQVSFTIDSTVEAIKWAVAEKVDIISMSWSIDEDGLDYKTNRENALRVAINLAADNNILLFCANPDKGVGYDMNNSYPRKLDTERVFCIGAATQDGNRWKEIDAKDGSCDYFLPGVDLGFQVQSSAEHRIGEPPTRWETHNGSSLACALAVGLAAMILHCAQVSGKNAAGEQYARLKSHDGMRKAFDSLHKTDNRWLPVRRVFGNATFMDDQTSKEEKMKYLSDVVGRFFV